MALPVVLLNGCSANEVLEDEDEPTTSENAIASNEASDAGAKKAAAKEPCPDEDAAPPKATCESVLASAFKSPDGGDLFSWEPSAQSKEVIACCDEELTKNGFESSYRWQCCFAYDPDLTKDPGFGMTNAAHGMTCTPWGPPVPPAMSRVRRANPEIAAWIAKAVA